MRRFTAVLLSLSLMLSLAACGTAQTEQPQKEQPPVSENTQTEEKTPAAEEAVTEEV